MCVQTCVIKSMLMCVYRLRDSCDINRLPDKLVLYVLSHLPPRDILNAAQVCTAFSYPGMDLYFARKHDRSNCALIRSRFTLKLMTDL